MMAEEFLPSGEILLFRLRFLFARLIAPEGRFFCQVGGKVRNVLKSCSMCDKFYTGRISLKLARLLPYYSQEGRKSGLSKVTPERQEKEK